MKMTSYALVEWIWVCRQMHLEKSLSFLKTSDCTLYLFQIALATALLQQVVLITGLSIHYFIVMWSSCFRLWYLEPCSFALYFMVFGV